MANDAAAKIFGKAGTIYERVVQAVLPVALAHHYKFVDDAWYAEWTKSDNFSPVASNQIVALELIEKAHLSSVAAMHRTMQWVNAAIVMYEAPNFLGWAAATRGTLESAGDAVDSLRSIPFYLAEHHRAIIRALNGDMSEGFAVFSDGENLLDHFVHAKWMRGPSSPTKAKDNAEYIEILNRVAPSAMPLYRRLCGISHPSSASIEFLFRPESDGMSLDIGRDRSAIDDVLKEFPDTLGTAIQLGFNSSLLILRVLHKFGRHPKLLFLKQIRWDLIPAWAEIEKLLQA